MGLKKVKICVSVGLVEIKICVCVINGSLSMCEADDSQDMSGTDGS